MFLESKIFQNCTLNFYYSRMRHLEITLSLYFVPELYCLTFRHVRIDSVGTLGKYRKEHNLSGVCYLSQLLRLFPFFKINRTVSGICEYSSDKQEDLTKRSWHVGRIRTSSGVTLFHFDGRTPLPAWLPTLGAYTFCVLIFNFQSSFSDSSLLCYPSLLLASMAHHAPTALHPCGQFPAHLSIHLTVHFCIRHGGGLIKKHIHTLLS